VVLFCCLGEFALSALLRATGHCFPRSEACTVDCPSIWKRARRLVPLENEGASALLTPFAMHHHSRLARTDSLLRIDLTQTAKRSIVGLLVLQDHVPRLLRCNEREGHEASSKRALVMSRQIASTARSRLRTHCLAEFEPRPKKNKRFFCLSSALRYDRSLLYNASR